MENKYPELFQFFGCYFHQDWMCESTEPDGVVRAFVSDSVPQTIEAVKKEISTLLTMNFSEDAFREFLMDEMPCNYCYWMEWESAEAWLNHILKILNSDNVDFDER
ncbi:contact-dependent growth inhibition system immunity protein [Pseudomonas bijieensis]|jgi:hypothetical protein|uniref:CdiI immunity protein domain-containing protein n=1 Tax=Pseudomonas bijieensis TaxID=2681983 RepID=A0A6N1CIY9_9PSED|nr:contact-dependent growth inhibition system immunity protein [Pseudomonas bijieensis]QKS84442.1 hypothetical protein GN234_21865 [Pseudomonas bijieensis]